MPTLSLQLLAENAIKHNVVTKDRPLEVLITNENDYIFIKNNLQSREEIIESTSVELDNLKQRFMPESYWRQKSVT